MNQAIRKKVRELGILIGTLPTGKKNCITDVRGVRVGHVTIDRPLDDGKQDYACTGVTAILPHGGNLFLEKVIAASYVINGFGKTTGLVQVNKLGVLESPIMLTN
ncbi:P1 family peptidase, partial [Brevibacillus laterosporus]|uniref:P1 family peptidase n=1 Tax=Brevibacillus laterosporus TaxID=1465 RepID=UPI00215BC69D